MQVKILGPEYSITKLEDRINQWLNKRIYKKIVDIKVVSEGSFGRFCAMIVYEEQFFKSSTKGGAI